MQMPSFKLARTAKWRLRKSLSACYEHIKNWKVKAFRKVFIWLYQPCSVQASHSWLPFHPLERNTQTLSSSTDVYDDIYRRWLSFALELSTNHESSSVWLEAWNETRGTIPAASCETVNLSTALKHAREVAKGLFTHCPHLTRSLHVACFQRKSAWQLALMWLSCGSCTRPMPQTGILTFAVQIGRI